MRSGDFVALRTRIREDGKHTRLCNVVNDPFEERDLSSVPEYADILKRLEAVLDGRFRE